MTTETTQARVEGTLDPLLARLMEYVSAVEEVLMQTEVGRNAWPRYAERLREAGEALKCECAKRRSSHSERSEVVVKRFVGNPAERWRSQDHTTPCMGREEPLDHALIANAGGEA
jgi:hypothetical protein